MPIACGNYCGSIGDGCGHTLPCAGCGAGQMCNSGICSVPGCVPLTCNAPGGNRYCGMVGDGCGGTLACGDCPAGGVCGGGGVANVCTNPNCMPVSCTFPSGQYCDMIGDGCGRVLSCGACPGGAACGGGAMPVPNVCPVMMGTGGCVGLQCQVPTCTGTATTSISGTVYDPAGKVPLYNVIVYIPNAPLDPIPEGVSCDRCSAQVSGHPIATALTDTNGHFQLVNVPATTNVPLVMQVGKWRRIVSIPTVTGCVDNAITDINLTRLPRTQAEGHIPKIAITTGGADALECLVRRIGVADTEFTTAGGAGRVHLFAGGNGTNSFMAGGAFAAAADLWAQKDPLKLSDYDILVQSCEGSTSAFLPQKPQTSVDNVANYANSGGRLFLSHLHFYWLQKRADFASTGSYIGNLATPPDPVALTINQTFPKGMALAQWLNGPAVAASTTLGQLIVTGSEHSVTGVNPPTTEWVYLAPNPNDNLRSSQYLSFDTPVGAAEANQCGKVVFTDIHIQKSYMGTGGDDSDPAKPFPSGCKTNATSPQGKALEFLFFDLSACLQPDGTTPVPPIVPPPGVPGSPPPSVTTPPPVPPPPPPPPPPPVP